MTPYRWSVYLITRKIQVIPHKVNAVRDEIVFHDQLGSVYALTAQEALFSAIRRHGKRHLAVINNRDGLCTFRHKWDESQPLTSETGK